MEKKERIRKIEIYRTNVLEQKQQIEFFLTEINKAKEKCLFDSNVKDSINLFLDNVIRESEILDNELGIIEGDIKFIEKQN